MARPTFTRGGAYDKQLEDLIQASSWKQALSLCEKRIKKGDRGDENLVRYVLRDTNEPTLDIRLTATSIGGKSSRPSVMARP